MITDEKQFTKAKEIEIPDIFYRRLKTGVEEVDAIFGAGILPGATMTLCGVAGTGKCHHPDELIQIFAEDDEIEKIEEFLKNSREKKHPAE